MRFDLSNIQHTNIEEVLEKRSRMEERIQELQKELQNATSVLDETNSFLRGLIEEVTDDEKSRVNVGSKRARVLIRRAVQQRLFNISRRPPAIVFEDRFTGCTDAGVTGVTGVTGITSLIASAFKSCGDGSLIFRHLVDAWNDDPAFQYMKDENAKVVRTGCIVTQAQSLLDMGLCTLAAVAEVLGGCFDLSGAKLSELKAMAKSMSLKLTHNGVPKPAETLRKECSPLMVMSVETYVAWKRYRSNVPAWQGELQCARFFMTDLVPVRGIPGRIDVMEEALNAQVMEIFPPLHPKVFSSLGMSRLPDDHPARYRPSLMIVLLQKLDEWRREWHAGQLAWDMPSDLRSTGVAGLRPEIQLRRDQRALQSWLTCAENEASIQSASHIHPTL